MRAIGLERALGELADFRGSMGRGAVGGVAPLREEEHQMAHVAARGPRTPPAQGLQVVLYGVIGALAARRFGSSVEETQRLGGLARLGPADEAVEEVREVRLAHAQQL